MLGIYEIHDYENVTLELLSVVSLQDDLQNVAFSVVFLHSNQNNMEHR